MTSNSVVPEKIVLSVIDDVWMTFEEVFGACPSLRRKQVASILRGLSRRRLIDSRVSDAHGRTEYAALGVEG